MTITEHKSLVAAIPEDLVEGEEIEVSDDGVNWIPHHFKMYYDGVNWIPYHFKMYHRGCIETAGNVWQYARRPAAAQKKLLRDQPWELVNMKFRWTTSEGIALYSYCQPDFEEDGVYHDDGYEPDPSDWQNSLERRPE